MPKLPNERHEKFAQCVASEMKLTESYYAAGYQGGKGTAKTNSSRTAALPHVAARIKELRDESRDSALAAMAVGKEHILKELMATFRQATDEGKYAPAVRALEVYGKELGMFADRLQLENLDAELEGKSTDELRNEMAQACSEIGMRVVGMTDEQTRDYIRRNAPRVGMTVIEPGVVVSEEPPTETRQ